MGDSEVLFRMRWFLLGSMSALLIAHRLNITVRPAPAATLETAPQGPAEPRAIPRAMRRTAKAGQPLSPTSSEPAPSEGAPSAPAVPPSRARKASADAGVAPGPSTGPKANARPAIGGVVRSLLHRADADLARLRRAPGDAEARVRAEQLLDRVTRALPAPQQVEPRRCLTQASFEGRADAAANVLQRCAARLREALE